MTPTTRLNHPELAVARRQHWVVTTDQLLALGLSAEAIRHRVRSGRLHRVHKGVYAVGRPDLTREGRWMAAVLACAPDGVLGDLAAAALWQLVERYDGPPHVLVPTQAGRSAPRGVRLHRCATLVAADVTRHSGIPVTGLERTLRDVARTAPDRLKACVRAAERTHGLDLAALHAACLEPETDIGRARLRRLLAVYVPVGLSESEFEARFLELCDRHRLPRPDQQLRVARHRADFVWHDVRLVVETDGRDTHARAMAFRDDRVKDRALKRAGHEVLRFTWGEVVHESGPVAREVREARARRRRELAGRVEWAGS